MVKTYNFKSTLRLKIDGVPKNIVIDTTEYDLDLVIKGNGLNIWQYNLSDNTLNLKFKDLQKDSVSIRFNEAKIKNAIAETHDFNSDNISFANQISDVNYKLKETKLVPIINNISLKFKKGFNSEKKISLRPDSVLISGSKSNLAKVESVFTKKLNLSNVQDTLNAKVPIVKPSANIELVTDYTNYFLPVEKYSENSLMIDILVLNSPDNLEIDIFPNQAKVSFLIPVRIFDKILSSDFRVVCDFESRFESEGVMIPKLIDYPEGILSPSLKVRKVDYLVKQKS